MVPMPKAPPIQLRVNIAFDEAAQRWHVSATHIPGLWLEADTASELLARIHAAAPEMIALNHDEIMRRLHRPAQPGPLAATLLPVFDTPLTVGA